MSQNADWILRHEAGLLMMCLQMALSERMQRDYERMLDKAESRASISQYMCAEKQRGQLTCEAAERVPLLLVGVERIGALEDDTTGARGSGSLAIFCVPSSKER